MEVQSNCCVQEDLLKICIKSKGVQKGQTTESKKYDSKSSRRLLAASSDNPCQGGKEPLWSSELIHKVHILIFLIAVSHVLYAMTSVAISVHAMHRWRRFECSTQSGELLDLPVDQLQREGESKVHFALRQAIRQFTSPVDQPTYLALRRMFIKSVQACFRSSEPTSALNIF
jgi:hypothetical protein